jgi:NifU-like protein involved in Fe-S cluster formation
VTTSRFTAATIDHFQHPRNVGRMADADRAARVDDAVSETTINLYVKLGQGLGGDVVARASFRTFGCSACIAASSVATELLVGRAEALSVELIDSALGGLPEDKRYCAELVASATRQLFSSA